MYWEAQQPYSRTRSQANVRNHNMWAAAYQLGSLAVANAMFTFHIPATTPSRTRASIHCPSEASILDYMAASKGCSLNCSSGTQVKQKSKHHLPDQMGSALHTMNPSQYASLPVNSLSARTWWDHPCLWVCHNLCAGYTRWWNQRFQACPVPQLWHTLLFSSVLLHRILSQYRCFTVALHRTCFITCCRSNI